jgi:hypothetical protein
MTAGDDGNLVDASGVTVRKTSCLLIEECP